MLILPTLFKSVLAAGFVIGLISAFFAALTKFGPMMCCTSTISRNGALTNAANKGRQSWRGELDWK